MNDPGNDILDEIIKEDERRYKRSRPARYIAWEISIALLIWAIIRAIKHFYF